MALRSGPYVYKEFAIIVRGFAIKPGRHGAAYIGSAVPTWLISGPMLVSRLLYYLSSVPVLLIGVKNLPAMVIAFNASPATLRKIQHICLEYHDWMTRYTHDDLARFLRQHGFHVTCIPSRAYRGLGLLYAARNETRDSIGKP